jgi:hypothetical protein
MNALAGAITSGQYLRGNGTNVLMSSIQAGDVPTLNQNTTGSAATLTTARDIQTNLASTAAASFNGSANITPGVTGTLPVGNGGTGQTTYTNGQLLIGNTTGNTLTKATLTAGTGISITNGTGSITVAATNNGTVTSVSGTGTVQGLTLSGTVTSSGSLTLGGSLSAVDLASQVTGDLPFSNLAQGSALSVLGVTGNATADVGSIAAGTDHQVLRRSGTSVAFGAVNLAQAAATTGSLPVNKGGTGAATLTANNVILGNGTSAVQFVAPGTSGNVLTSNGTAWLSQASVSGNASYDTATAATGFFAMPVGTTAQRPGSPATGQVRYNTTETALEIYESNQWKRFTTNAYPFAVEYIVIAGGGSGGANNNAQPGGGGAGGYRSSITGEPSGGGASAESTITVSPGTSYTVTVGAGGPSASGGSNSVFHTVTSTGGGRGNGVSGSWYPSTSGGSGGGGGGTSGGAAGTANQGYAGGNYSGSTGGGGGGAAGIGGTPTTGGASISSNVTGTPVARARGGNGGSGGGAGTVNTGNGGGAGPSAGGGGSGVVILKYPNSFTISLGVGLTGTTSNVGSNKVTVVTAGTGNVSWS